MPKKEFSICGILLRKVNFQFSIKGGYSLIELLVVVSIFGITATLVTASYLSFEKNQRLKNGALQLKSDIRYIQNKALASDKNSAKCATAGYTVFGWYVNLTNNSATYALNSDCKNGGGVEDADTPRSVSLPRGVVVCGLGGYSGVNVLFQPLISNTVIYTAASTPPFLDSNGILKTGALSAPFTVGVGFSSPCPASGYYQVVISATGEVNEKQM